MRFKMKKIILLFTLSAILFFAKPSYAQFAITNTVPTNEIIISFTNETSLNSERIKMRSTASKLAITGNFLTMKYNSASEAEAQLQILRERKDVEYAGINYIYSLQKIQNDPSRGSQYFLDICRFPEAWNLVKGTEQFIVASPDTGFDESLSHEDLSLKLPGYNFVYNNQNFSYELSKPSAHGLQTAGMIGALTDNGKGISSGSWRVRQIPIRIGFTSTDPKDKNYYSSTTLMMKAIDYAARNGAKVINFSYGYVPGWDLVYTYAKKYHDQGVVVLFAAGNSNDELRFGPTSKYLIYVGATDSADKRATFSNFGIGVDVFAPGVNCLTLNIKNKYGGASGTSFSAPLVGSLIVLMKMANPSLNTIQIKRILKNTAQDLGAAGWDNQFSWGRIDAIQAVRAALGQIPIVDNKNPIVQIMKTNDPYVNIYSNNPSGIVRDVYPIFINAEDNFEVQKLELFIDDILLEEKFNLDYSLQWYYLKSRNYSNGTHVLKARATDVTGLTSEHTLNITINNTTADTTPPTVNISSPGNNAIVSGQFTLKVDATDDDVISKVEIYIDNILVTTLNQAPYTYVLNTNDYSLGTKTFKAIAYDQSNNKAESIKRFKFTSEIDTTPPTILITTPETLTIAKPGTSLRFSFVTRDDGGIARVNLYRNNELIKSSIIPPFIIFSPDFSGLFGTNYTFYAEAIDTSGNIGRSLPIVIRLRQQ